MWSLLRSTSHGGFSVRSIFRHVLTAVIAVLLLTFLAAPSTHAADAAWSNESTITYQTNPYLGPAQESLLQNLGLPSGTQAYTYVEPDPSSVMNGGSNSSNSPPSKRLIHVLYVASDVDLNTTSRMKYRTYEYNGPTSFSNPSNPVDITIDVREGSTLQGTTSCDVSGGLGWIICPVTNFLAEGMDWVYQILAGFLTVQPLQTNQDNALYRAWTYMRSFANVAFVIAFLIIIYAQISNVGLSNYDIKKMVPRLIIAALLVNLSYFICAVLIDVSNILGWSLQDIFINMRNTLVGPEGNGWEVTSWQSITGFILSGGTAVTAAGIGLFTTLTSYGIAGSLFLLLPALVAGLVAVLVALIIMAARQAIIIILVMIAPLAFVAYLLPNTEKWFEKWRSVFTTMLVLFPAFSVVFGGSQLAATAIIQSADSINMIILGMMVQVAPLVITPLLVKLSGSLLGRIAGIVNNPQKGLIDRTRNYAKDRADNIKARRLGDARPHQFLRQGAQWRDERRRNREGLASAAGAEADARWANDRRFSNIDQRTRRAGDYKSLGEARSEERYALSKIVRNNQTRLTDTQRIGVELYNAQKSVDEAKHEVDIQYGRLQAKRTADNLYPEVLRKYGNVARHNYERSQGLKSQLASIETVIQQEYAETLKASEEMRRFAGGIDPNGAQRALASSLNTLSEAHAKTQANLTAIMNHANLSNDQTLALAKGQAQEQNGIRIDATKDAIEAAITRVASGGSYYHMLNLVESLDLTKNGVEDHRIALVDALRKNSGRPKFYGFTWLDKVTQGVAIDGQAGVDQEIKFTVNARKFSSEVLVSQDQDVIKRVRETIDRGTDGFDMAAFANLKRQIIEAYSNPEYSGRIAERDPHLRKIMEQLDAEGIIAEGMTAAEEASRRDQFNL